jgi:circadian clock protein KaiC
MEGSAMKRPKDFGQRVSSGIAGLDEVLGGGFIERCAYLVRGGPGTGKTMLGLHFLTAGATLGERCLFITLGEPEAQVRRNGMALGFALEQVKFLDLSPTPQFFVDAQAYDIFSPAEVELEPTTRRIVEEIETFKPQRVFLDAMTQFRYLSSEPFQFFKQVLSFLRFLVAQGATVAFTSEASPAAPDEDMQFMADGVIALRAVVHGRGVSVMKFRGSNFLDGWHSLRLTGQGMQVFPRLMPEMPKREVSGEMLGSGVAELDALLHGGLERGTATIVSGPSGVGKTTLCMQFLVAAAARGEPSLAYTFEESVGMVQKRCAAINLPLHQLVERGSLLLQQVEPLRYTPEEFYRVVLAQIDASRARNILLDSLPGFRLALRGEDLTADLHVFCRELRNRGLTVLLVDEVESITGDFQATEAGLGFLADNIIFLRFLEVRGALRKAIGVLKKRLSDFEKTLREIEITSLGIRVGPPLSGLRGILTGTPEWRHEPGELGR